MNAKEFFDKVCAMREAQNRYFKYRTSDELSKARQLEKIVDDEIRRVLALLPPSDRESMGPPSFLSFPKPKQPVENDCSSVT